MPFPPRPAGALTGSQLAGEIASVPQAEREARVLHELLHGNVPDRCRSFTEVTVEAVIGGARRTATYRVTNDYLAIGSDGDFLRMPMTPLTAQAFGDVIGCLLPTSKMVDQIYQAAPIKLEPQPFNPGRYDTESVSVFCLSNQAIQDELSRRGAAKGALVAGIKKDVVISVRLGWERGKVAIYGWNQPSRGGKAIQPLSTVHGVYFMDYSHGLRMVQRSVVVDGKRTTLEALLADPVLHVLVSSEGPVKVPRYTGAAPEPRPPAGAVAGTGVNPGAGWARSGSNKAVAPRTGPVGQLPAGTLGLDRSMPIGAQAAQLFSMGYRFAIRNVRLPENAPTGALTADEAAQIHAAGLALGLYQQYRMKGITPEQGAVDGEFIAMQARELGFPAGQAMVLWCDLESTVELRGTFYGPDGQPVTAATMRAYLERWADSVTSAGYAAGLYSGPQALLSSDDLTSLDGYTGFWRAESAQLPTPAIGYQMLQKNANKMVLRINIDDNFLQKDARGGLPTFWLPR